MPNSLIPDRPVTTAQVQKFNLSPGEIAAPFNDLAKAVDATAGAAEAGAEKLAVSAGQEAGRKAVRTDDSGNLVVSDTRNPFIIGKAGEMYERAARMTTAAQIAPNVETDMLKLRLAHPNDPGGFKSAATAYTKRLLDGDPDNNIAGIQDPAIRNAVGDMALNSAMHNERTALVDANAHNTAEAFQTYQARIKDITEQIGLLARQGAGSAPVASDAYKTFQAKAHDLAAFYSQLQGDDRFKYSADRAKLELDEHYAGFKVQDIIGKEQRKFQADPDKNLLKAKTSFYDAFWGPNAPPNLTVAQRDHGFVEGIKAIQNTDAIDREAIMEHRKAVANFLTDSIRRPRDFDIVQANNLKQRAVDIGDKRSADEIDERARFQPFASSFITASPNEQSEMFGKMLQGNVPAFRLQSNIKAMMDAAPPEVRAGMSVTSGVRTPEQQADLFRAAVQKYGSEEEARKWVAPPGHSQHEAGNAADLRFDSDATRQWIHANAGKYGLTFPLANEPWHIEAAGARAGELAEGKIDLSTSAATGRIFEQFVKEGAVIVGKNAETAFERIEKSAKEGAPISQDDVQHFVEMASRSGRDDLLEKGKSWIAAYDAANNRPPGETIDTAKGKIAEARAMATTPFALDALDHTQLIMESNARLFAENPRAASAAKGWVGAPQDFDFTNPTAFGSNVEAREKDARVIGQHVPNVGPIPAIMPQEAQRFGAVLTQGDPKAASAMLLQLQANTSPENWRATMAVPAIKEAVTGMLNSNDPARMDAGGQAMDRLWSTNEPDFKRTYGEGALNRLMAWKGLAALTPDERTERLNKADDPFSARGREEASKAIDSEFSSWGRPMWPTSSASRGACRWCPTASRSFRISRTSSRARPPAAPADGVAAYAMQAQFKDTVKSLRIYGVDPGTARRFAIEQMKGTWQPTGLIEGAGDVLMKHAPESYYPTDPISKNHDWMKSQLADEITRVMGPKETTESLQGEGQVTHEGWTLKGIVSDNQTEQEIAAGKPPSYKIHIIDAKGQDQFLRDHDTGRDRYVWDPKAMMAPRQAEMNRVFNRGSAPYQTLGQEVPFMARFSNPQGPMGAP
jgi:hypothetical protein